MIKHRTFWLLSLLLLCVSACSPAMIGNASQNGIRETPSVVPSSTPYPTETPLPTATFTPAPTETPTPTPTPVWVFNPPGKADVPILLYHHVTDLSPSPLYHVNVDAFREQMTWLRDNGYTTISISLLADALIKGAELPPRPVVVTFDDGHLDVFENAYPIMKELGQVGTLYLVSSWTNGSQLMQVDQVKEMIASGWEIGSHSKSHVNLTLNHGSLVREVRGSKAELSEIYGVDVVSFAYPFGEQDEAARREVVNSRYKTAVGLLNSYHQGMSNLYLLWRIEVGNRATLDEFAQLLPWKD